MRAVPSALLLVLAALVSSGAGAAPGGGKTPEKNPEINILDITKGPSPRDWQHFLRAPERQREDMWARHAARKIPLGAWSWQWRLGWVRACADSRRPYCDAVLRDALADDALVVRAEAATRVGARRDGSNDEAAVQLLSKAYRDPRNLRHGKPLFVQQRILFALTRIGPAGGAAATTLGASHPSTRAYLARLAGGATPR